MRLIMDEAHQDAVVIQGVAGAGKSSFTLRLCSELEKHGFHPLRIRLRDVSLNANVTEALRKAILLHDDARPLSEAYRSEEDLFLGGSLFEEGIGNICPWVLILDGWDEISLSAAKGFRAQVARMLGSVRDEYLKNRRPLVRVVITGRLTPISDTVTSCSTILRF